MLVSTWGGGSVGVRRDSLGMASATGLGEGVGLADATSGVGGTAEREQARARSRSAGITRLDLAIRVFSSVWFSHK